MKPSNHTLYKDPFLKEKKPALPFTAYFLFLALITSICPLSAQEVFDNTATGEYSANTQIANLYDLALSNSSTWQNDFKHSTNTAYKLQGNANTGTADRFGNPSQALYFNQYQNITIPSGPIKDIVSSNNGFSVSAWIKVPDNGKDCSILSFTNPANGNKEDIQLRMKDGYFQILKYSTVAQKKVVLGQARYKISYYSDNTQNEIYPGPDEYGAGYIYFMLSSNKYSTRLYFSRPGGRLYANYFWFGLSDVLTNTHTATFGTVNNQQGAILSAVDDIMVYKEMLTPELANNHFLVQSPIYPSRSYIVRNYQNKPIAPEGNTYESGYIKAISVFNPYEGTYGGARWQLPVREISGGKKLINFLNAKSYLPIARWNANSGNYFYQENGDYNSGRQLFEALRITNPNNLTDYKQNTFTFLINEYRSDMYQLGFSGDELYVQYPNKPDDNWSIQGSFSTAVREKFSSVSELGVRLINYGTKQSMALYNSSGSNYYLYQSSSTFEPFSLARLTPRFSEANYKYGYEDFRFSNMAKNSSLALKGGIKSTTEQDYLWLDEANRANFQLSYVKDDPNGKPLYLVRINNGYGARILIPNYETGGYTYITQNSIVEDGPSYPDNYLWSLNMIYIEDGDIVVARTTKAARPDITETQALNVYPNPVKGNATIEYTLSKSGPVKVYITSATGALVKTVQENTQNKGTYKESLDTSGWVSGVYFCVLQTDGQKIITKKIIVQ
ncbi:T9SS type A sorting domain-containing protein [Chryseobacterium sp. WG23]|uniref:T9SS type A sorting domain-containing protein n=1 Tax=Chryseobacterium sp. WG23 TaxID=2926910 RepID=UPI00211EDB7C|nr:T9SS type A sorting domain-containing protein [Chryseobacterium sp. WG23]MCQ9633441.1 T9SS type A sorting domain-containing protein [Chryseobacterium sp. WG23]